MEETLQLLSTKRVLAFILGVLLGVWFQRGAIIAAFIIGFAIAFLIRMTWFIHAFPCIAKV